MRELPSVFGFTRSSPRNSATPSSYDSSSCSKTSCDTGCTVDLGEPVPAEELDLEGEAEDPGHPEVPSLLKEPAQQQVADPTSAVLLVDGEGAHLGEVLPQDVQGSAADHHAVDLGDVELLDVLEERDCGLRQQDAIGGVGVDELSDRPDVTGAGLADVDRRRGHSGFTRGKRIVSRTPRPVSVMTRRSMPIP